MQPVLWSWVHCNLAKTSCFALDFCDHLPLIAVIHYVTLFHDVTSIPARIGKYQLYLASCGMIDWLASALLFVSCAWMCVP